MTEDSTPEAKELRLRREYEASASRNALLAASAHAVCRALLDANDIPFHSVKSRVKACDSVLEKIDRKKYRPAMEFVTDIVGVRIVCLYKQHIDPVADLLATEFEIVQKIDKRPDQDPDRFGYSSLHLLCRLRPNRSTLAEYSTVGTTIVEIQIRTILQEAWAEIEHRLIYKGVKETPSNIRREIARTAAMLETADGAFDEAYNRHNAYKASLQQKDLPSLKKEPLNVSSLLEVIRREMQWAVHWDRDRDVQSALANLLLDLHEQGINHAQGLVELISKWNTTVDVENKSRYEIAKTSNSGFSAHGDPLWAEKTKRYFNPVGVIRSMLRHEYPEFQVTVRAPA